MSIVADAGDRLSHRQIAAKFHAITGRKIGKTTVRWARFGYQPLGLDAKGIRLSPSQKRLLRKLFLSNQPHCCRREIARQFEGVTGRPIHHCTVSRMAKAIGLPSLPFHGPASGTDGSHGFKAGVERRKAEVAREKQSRQSILETKGLPE